MDTASRNAPEAEAEAETEAEADVESEAEATLNTDTSPRIMEANTFARGHTRDESQGTTGGTSCPQDKQKRRGQVRKKTITNEGRGLGLIAPATEGKDCKAAEETDATTRV